MRRKFFKAWKRYGDMCWMVFCFVGITGMIWSVSVNSERAEATDRVAAILQERLEIDRAVFEMMKGVKRAESKR